MAAYKPLNKKVFVPVKGGKVEARLKAEAEAKKAVEVKASLPAPIPAAKKAGIFSTVVNAWKNAPKNIIDTYKEAQAKKASPVQRFEVGNNLSNVTKVLPGPRISTLEAMQRGDTIQPVKKDEAPVVSPNSIAKNIVRYQPEVQLKKSLPTKTAEFFKQEIADDRVLSGKDQAAKNKVLEKRTNRVDVASDYIVGKTKKLGKTLGVAMAANSNNYQSALYSISKQKELETAIQKQIIINRKKGMDVSRLEAQLKSSQANTPQNSGDILGADANKTGKQVGGEALGTLLDILMFTTGIGKTAELANKSSKLAKEMSTLTKGQQILHGVEGGAKIGGGFGAGYGAATAMQDNKGLGEIANETVKQGVIGAGFGGILGGIGGALTSKKLVKPREEYKIPPKGERTMLPEGEKRLMLPEEGGSSYKAPTQPGFVTHSAEFDAEIIAATKKLENIKKAQAREFAQAKALPTRKNFAAINARKVKIAEVESEIARLNEAKIQYRGPETVIKEVQAELQAVTKPSEVDNLIKRQADISDNMRAVGDTKLADEFDKAFLQDAHAKKDTLTDNSRIILNTSDNNIAKEEAEILSELQNSKAGFRYSIDEAGTGGTKKTVGVKSTFPDWIPDDLRRNSIIKPVVEHIYAGTMPTKVSEKRLYEVVKTRIETIGQAKSKLVNELDVAKIDFGVKIKGLETKATALEKDITSIQDGAGNGFSRTVKKELELKDIKEQLIELKENQAGFAKLGADDKASTEVTEAVSAIRGLKTGKRTLDPSKYGEDALIQETISKNFDALGLGDYKVRTWEDVSEAARIMGTDVEGFIKMVRRGPRTDVEFAAVRSAIKNKVKESLEIAKKLDDITITPRQAEALGEDLAQIEKDINSLYAKEVLGGTEIARALAIRRMIAKDITTPEYWVQIVARELRRAGFTGKNLTDEIISSTAEIRRLLALGDRDGLSAFITSKKYNTTAEKVVTVWKAGLLTLPTTHLANILGNTTFGVLERVSEKVTASLDKLVSLATGKERTIMSKTRVLYGDLGAGVSYGQTTKDEMLRKVNFVGKSKPGTATYGIKKGLQVYTDAVYGALEVEDKIFFQRRFREVLYNEARVEAHNGLIAAGKSKYTKQELADEISVLWNNPTDDMLKNATTDAEYSVFRNSTLLSEGISNVKGYLLRKDSPYAKAGYIVLEQVAPFSKTPSAISYATLQYSPAGFVDALVQGLSGKGRRQIEQTLGRAITGSALWGVGAYLATKGLLTGAAPKDAAGKAEWQEQGKVAYSIKLAGRFRPIAKLGPAGMSLLLGGAMLQSITDNTNAKDLVGSMFGDFTQIMSNQTYLKGMSAGLDALTSPEDYKRQQFISQQVASIVPSFVAGIARSYDPVQRYPKSTWEAIKARFPGLSTTVMPRRTAFGHLIKDDRNKFIATTDRLVNPLYQNTPYKPNKIIETMNKLDFHTSMPGQTLTVPESWFGKNVKVPLEKRQIKMTDTEYDKYQKEIGESKEKILGSLINTKGFNELGDDEKKRLLKSTETKVEEAYNKYVIMDLLAAKMKKKQ